MPDDCNVKSLARAMQVLEMFLRGATRTGPL